jgi:hypothetical protein
MRGRAQRVVSATGEAEERESERGKRELAHDSS